MWTSEVGKAMQAPNMKALESVSGIKLVEKAKEAAWWCFEDSIGEVYSVGVFKPFRGQGVARFMYAALDHILMAGLPTSRDHTQHFTSIHIGCSAPETMHLCEKFGYTKISEVVYS